MAAFLAILFVSGAVAGLWSKPQSQDKQKILFAVWPPQKGKKPQGPILDPIAIFDGSALTKLPEEDYDKGEPSDDEIDRFEKTYYTPGKQYRLFFGGSELGSATVVEPTGLGCISFAATVRTSVPVPNGQYALAKAELSGGLHANWREKASPEQEAEFLSAAATFLTSTGVKGVTTGALRIKNLRATRLGEKRPTALVGTIATYRGSTTDHDLFLVIEQKQTNWDVLVASDHASSDLEDHTDEINENFVDQIDLASEGTDEIVTIRGYYESWDYAVYKFEKGVWKNVYHGGGGGC
jgi:hypothetical protein